MLTAEAKLRFDDLLDGYTIINAQIAEKDRLVLITKNTGGLDSADKVDTETTTEFVLYNPKYHKEKHGITTGFWKHGIPLAWGSYAGNESKPTVFCDLNARTCEFLSDGEWNNDSGWKKLPDSTVEFPMLRSLLGVCNIANDVYIYGAMRKLYKRIGEQKWKDITDESEHLNLHADILEKLELDKDPNDVSLGFYSVDGFEQNDIYGVGNGGDLWHYNGEIWSRLDPPTNFDMRAVICAGDGNVYIAGAMGQIIKGRFDSESGEVWEILESPITEIIHTLAWFKGKVYVGVEYGLYTIDKEGTVEDYEFPENGPQQYSFRNVTACEDALLSYGGNQALVFDGKSWEQIVGKIILSVPEAFDNLMDS